MNFDQASEIDFDRSSIDTKQSKASILYNILPAIVQNRIPAIPSIRRTISQIQGRTVPDKSDLEVTEVVHPTSPPPGYSTRPSSAVSSNGNISNRSSVAFSDAETTVHEEYSERPESAYSTPPAFSVSETRTGINWKYANQGVSLSTQAYAESHALARKDDETSTFLTRQLYIHGLTYLLRGLPSDLTPEETLSLQAAIPHSLALIHNEPCAHTVVPFMQEGIVAQGAPQDSSLLHRITAILVFQTFVLIRFLLPYIKVFIGHAYRFEREHKVTQRLVNNGIMTADALRRTSLQLSRTICQMNDGKVGKALNDLTLWWIGGLTGGLQQGIREGVMMMSNDRGNGALEGID
ncbi:hypothetical protein K458DRAFT_356559 [Lentithecium fluviatile CBS 122367]|uniref:Uncharacterized protein n=1 Tax=Lentithecium fluviatile CBS 122367 TaxID=1168545 RepID=A0A6G1JII3_9PLEO|nr:hypothetical protein K458DRAFT_356559 [Lentithecium fluviatile CBS 122367]